MDRVLTLARLVDEAFRHCTVEEFDEVLDILDIAIEEVRGVVSRPVFVAAGQ